MPETTPWNLISSNLRNEAGDEEKKELSKWLAATDSNRQLYTQIKTAWDLSAGDHHHFKPDEAKAWQNISESAGLQMPRVKYIAPACGKGVRGMYSKLYTLPVIRYAAAVLLISLLGLAAYWMTGGGGHSVPLMVEITVPQGQQPSFKLENGAQIWLNSGSTIRQLASGTPGETRLYLIGEAFIEMPENRSGSLVVATSHLDVKVTGTAFNVRAYPEEEMVETTLERGQVELHITAPGQKRSGPSVMQPDQRAVFNKINDQLEISEISTFEYTAWKNGILAFRNITFAELVSRLEKWFDVEITFDAGQFADVRFSGVYRNRENITQVLESVRIITPFEYRVENNTIIIE
ncbi:MAG: FecR family protein [Cyclonatronaceae bacterium]